jgi:hypothetical protein
MQAAIVDSAASGNGISHNDCQYLLPWSTKIRAVKNSGAQPMTYASHIEITMASKLRRVCADASRIYQAENS